MSCATLNASDLWSSTFPQPFQKFRRAIAYILFWVFITHCLARPFVLLALVALAFVLYGVEIDVKISLNPPKDIAPHPIETCYPITEYKGLAVYRSKAARRIVSPTKTSAPSSPALSDCLSDATVTSSTLMSASSTTLAIEDSDEEDYSPFYRAGMGKKNFLNASDRLRSFESFKSVLKREMEMINNEELEEGTEGLPVVSQPELENAKLLLYPTPPPSPAEATSFTIHDQ